MTRRILAAGVSSVSLALAMAVVAAAATRPVTLTMTGTPAKPDCKVVPMGQMVDPGDVVRFNVAMSVHGQGKVDPKHGHTNKLYFQTVPGPKEDHWSAADSAWVDTPQAHGTVGDKYTYTATFVDGDGKVVCTVDPEICVRGTSGCGSTAGHGHGHGKPTPKPTPHHHRR